MVRTWEEQLVRLIDEFLAIIQGGRPTIIPWGLLDLIRQIWNYAAGIPLEERTTLDEAILAIVKPIADWFVGWINNLLKTIYGLIRPHVVLITTVVGTAVGYYGILTRHEVPTMRRIIGIFVDPIISWMMGVVLDKLLPPDIPAPIPPSPPPPPPASLEYKTEVPASSEALGSYRLSTGVGGPTEAPAQGSVDAQYALITGLQLPTETPAQSGVEAAYELYLKQLLYSPETPAQGGVEAVYTFIYNIIQAAEVPATGEVETAYTLAYNIEQTSETPATGEVEAAYELAVPPPPYVPYWIVTAAYVASSDPGWPRRSKAMMKSCVHEYGKSTFGSMDMRWSYNVGPYVLCAVSGDVDSDGVVEVIVPQGDEYSSGSVYCLKGSDGSVKWSYSTGTECYYAVLLDIDGDGKLEIIVGNYNGYVYCINPDGTLRWSYQTLGATILLMPVVFDVDGDGAAEIIFPDVNGFVYCLGPDGVPKWSVQPAGDNMIYNTSAADIDGDGAVEVLAGSDAGYCICLRGSDGSLKWSYNVGSCCEAVTLFDVDGDGALEVLTNAEEAYRFYCLEPNGTLKWYYTAGNYVFQVAVAAYDIDGDDIVECLGGSSDFHVYCLEGPTGALKWRYNTGKDTGCTPCIADLDDDGLMEAATCHETTVLILEHDGTLKASLDVGYNGMVALDDVDGDKKLEIVVYAIYGYVYCLGPA